MGVSAWERQCCALLIPTGSGFLWATEGTVNHCLLPSVPSMPFTYTGSWGWRVSPNLILRCRVCGLRRSPSPAQVGPSLHLPPQYIPSCLQGLGSIFARSSVNAGSPARAKGGGTGEEGVKLLGAPWAGKGAPGGGGVKSLSLKSKV